MVAAGRRGQLVRRLVPRGMVVILVLVGAAAAADLVSQSAESTLPPPAPPGEANHGPVSGEEAEAAEAAAVASAAEAAAIVAPRAANASTSAAAMVAGPSARRSAPAPAPAPAHGHGPAAVDALPLDLDALWPFNDSFRLTQLDEIDRPPLEGAGHPAEASGGGERTGMAATSEDGPVFDADLVTNVTAQLGGPAFLRCRVRNLGGRAVSWIRRRDWHILTSGVFTYTNDERFQVAHSGGGDEWTLHIKYVQKRDNGTYECQVATGGGVISHYFNLHVVVPAAFILGSGEYHIGEGSTISLVCIIENSPTPPQYVFWYHNDNMINYESVRGGVTVSTEPGPKTHSRLLIHQATRADSGNYTCRAPNTEDDTIYVFVSQGDNTAAIQRQSSAAGALRRPGAAWRLAVTALAGAAALAAAVAAGGGSGAR